MIFMPTKCKECPAFHEWPGGSPGGKCKAKRPSNGAGLYDIDENVRPPPWCPGKEGITILVNPPIIGKTG